MRSRTKSRRDLPSHPPGGPAIDVLASRAAISFATLPFFRLLMKYNAHGNVYPRLEYDSELLRIDDLFILRIKDPIVASPYEAISRNTSTESSDYDVKVL